MFYIKMETEISESEKQNAILVFDLNCERGIFDLLFEAIKEHISSKDRHKLHSRYYAFEDIGNSVYFFSKK